jgi:hypothetical protein
VLLASDDSRASSRFTVPFKPLEIDANVLRVLIANVAIFLQRLGNDLLRLYRDLRIHLPWRCGIAFRIASWMTPVVRTENAFSGHFIHGTEGE